MRRLRSVFIILRVLLALAVVAWWAFQRFVGELALNLEPAALQQHQFWGSLLLGLPFTAITFYALQEARRVWPAAGDSFPGLLTAAYGIGQIVGPPMVAWMLHHAATQGQGFVYGLAVAAAALGVGAMLFAAMAWRWPLAHRPAAR